MSAPTTALPQTRWQYMEITRKTEAYLVNDLNQLGDDGWELVAVFQYKDPKSSMGSALCWTAFVKRPYTGPSRLASAQQASIGEQPAQKAVPAGQIDEGDLFTFKS